MKKNESGSALVTILIMMAVVSITLPIILTMLTNSHKRTMKRIKYQKYMEFASAMKEKLEDPVSCTQLLRGQQIVRNRNRKTDISLNTAYGATAGPIQPGWQSAVDSFTLEKVYIQLTGTNAGFKVVKPYGRNGLELDTVAFRVYFEPRDILIDLRSTASGSPKAPELIRPMNIPELQITLYANIRKNNNRIQSCYGAVTQASACEAYGGWYDPDPNLTNSILRCKPDTLCFNDGGGLRTINTTNPNVAKNRCPFPYKTHPQYIGVINSRRRWICSWCYENVSSL